MLYFRKTFELSELTDEFVINISGYKHFNLYVNNTFVTEGPGNSHTNSWKYATLNIASYLKKGKNVIGVLVQKETGILPVYHTPVQPAYI